MLADVAPAVGQGLDAAEPEGGVRHLVDDGGARGEDPVLDPQVGPAFRDAVARPVPAVHRSVVEAQGLELRNPAGGEDGEGVVADLGGDQQLEAGDVFAEDLEHRVVDPALAEADPRRLLPAVGVMAGVDRLAEDRDPGLAPQPLAEEQRRVGGGGEDRRRQRLGDVVEPGEAPGLDLEVDLEGGVAGLGHHAVVGHPELVAALDAELEIAPREPLRGLGDGEVARLRGHVVERQIGLVEGRQDAGQEDLGAELPGPPPGDGHDVVELRLEAAQGVGAEDDRIEIGLEVEPGELGGEPRVVDRCEDLERQGRRTVAAVDQEELLLGADAGGAGLEHALGEHLLQRPQVAQDLAHEGPQLFRRALLLDLRLAHGSPGNGSIANGF